MKTKEMKKINVKLMLILFALVPLVSSIIIFAVISSRIIVTNLEENTREELMLASKALQEYYAYDLINSVNLEDGFVEYEHEYIDAVNKKVGVDLTLFKDNIRYVTTILDASGKRIEGTPASDAVWAAVSKGEDYYSDDVVINGKDYYVYYMPLTDGTDVRGMAFSGKPADQIKAAEGSIYATVGVLSLIMIVVFSVIALLIAKKVADPLKAIAEGLEQISEGDTKIKIEATTNVAETAKLLAASQKLGEVLSTSVGRIRTSAETLTDTIKNTEDMAAKSAEATTQISESMQALSQTTMTMAENVQDINNNVMEMGDVVGQAIENIDNLNTNSTAMSEANKEASGCIRQVIASSERSAEAVEDITQRINTTNEAVTKINEMVALITSIASQTNLLSLNASIEAARAGEAGRGFAVVAEEIKTLAEQSDVSANQIKDIVSEIGVSSTQCVEQAQKVREIITEEKELLSITQEKFENLDANIQNSVSEIASVSAITAQLETIKDTIMNAVSDLSAISEETSATNEEVAASLEHVSMNVDQVSQNTETMSGLSDELKDAVSYFK